MDNVGSYERISFLKKNPSTKADMGWEIELDAAMNVNVVLMNFCGEKLWCV